MRIQMKTFQVPRQFAPIMVLLALVLIPFALIAAVAFGVMAIGATILRVLLPSSSASVISSPPSFLKTFNSKKSDVSAIDVEYEVKDPK